MKFISLFAGIGGMDLGLERAGMTCVAQVEIDDYATRVLAKHWPDVPRYRDVRDVGRHNLPACDLICGGFPCQDISNAGKRAGIDGERSGLWSEYARIVGELQPRYVLVENVAALLGRGISRVLGDLAALGYDAEWHCIPAAAVGAPHIRDRVFILAYRAPATAERAGSIGVLADAASNREWTDQDQPARPQEQEDGADVERSGTDVAYTYGERRDRRSSKAGRQAWQATQGLHGAEPDTDVAHADRSGCGEQRIIITTEPQQFAAECGGWWQPESPVCRVAHGVPRRVDRLRGLGNAVVPQVAEYIGRQMMQHERFIA